MTVISNSKFRYLILLIFLGTEYLLLKEEFDDTMKKKPLSCLYLGTYKYADGHALKKSFTAVS